MAVLAIDHSEGTEGEDTRRQTLIILSDVEHDPAAHLSVVAEPEEAAVELTVVPRTSLFDRPRAATAADQLRVRPSMLRRQADGSTPHPDHLPHQRPSALRRSNLSGLGPIR